MRATILIILIFVVSGCMTTTHRGTAIRDRLSETSGLAAHNISIDEVSPGYITLNGKVASDSDRDTIEKVARDTRGVREVKSYLAVDPSFIAVSEGYQSSSGNERGIASEISAKMSSLLDLRYHNINVKVVDGTVVLWGQVASESDRNFAEQIAQDTRGVRSVRNELTVMNRRYINK